MSVSLHRRLRPAATLTGTAASVKVKVGGQSPGPPWVSFRKNPAKWAFYTAQTRAYQVAVAHVGLFAVAGLYYLLLQTRYDVGPVHVFLKPWWDGLFSWKNWPTIRHLIRDCGEGFLGTLLALMLVTNYYKIKDNAVNRFLIKMSSGWTILLAPLVIILAAVPGFLLGYGVIEGLRLVLHAHTLNPTLSAHPSFVAKLYADDTDAKIVGVFGGLLFGHTAARPVFATILRFFATRRVARGKRDRVWQPVYFRALVRQTALAGTAAAVAKTHGALTKLGVTVAVVALLGFAYEGYYVIHHFA